MLRDEFLSWKVLRDAKSRGTAGLEEQGKPQENCLNMGPAFTQLQMFWKNVLPKFSEQKNTA